jgi:PAS domain S-box-containing protein
MNTMQLPASVIEQLPTAIAIFDREGRWLTASQRWLADWGLNACDLNGKSLTTIFPDLPCELHQAFARALTGVFSQQSSQQWRTPDGIPRWVKYEVQPWSENGAIAGAILKLEHLSPRQQHLLAWETVFELSPDMMCIAGFDGYFHLLNPMWEKTLGYTDSELKSKPFLEFVHPEDRQSTLEAARGLVEGKTYIDFENRYRCKDGSYRWLQWTATPIFNGGKIYAVVRDITQRKEAELEFQKLMALIAYSSDFIGVASLDGYPLFINPAGLQMMGLPSVDVARQQPINDFIWPDDLPLVEQTIMPTVMERGMWQGEIRFRHYLTQTPIPVDYNIFTIKHPETAKILAFATITRDLRDRKAAENALRQSEAELRQKAQELEQTLYELRRTQTQLIQTEKMSSLGQLVAGVAHEINNPVNFIYGNLTHAREYIKDLLEIISLYQEKTPNPGSEIRDRIEEIDLDFLLEDLPKLLGSMQVGAERIKQIVASLRNFSRTDETEFKAANIHEGIESTLMILRNRLKAKSEHPEIQIIKNYAEMPPVECYPGPLNQVFMNIIANAIDAIEEYNKRRNYEEIAQNPGMIHIQTQSQNDTIQIKISDNAGGIPNRLINRLFDPFFTTKAVGQGTGLGLSISHQIVTEKHGGTIECFSQLGQGTEFIITIPCKQATVYSTS